MSEIVRIGIDEVGRGCLWGPITIAAVAVVDSTPQVENVRDSKTVKSEKVRGRLAQKIKDAHAWHTGTIGVEVIDKIGIDAATKQGQIMLMDKMIAWVRSFRPICSIVVTFDGHDQLGTTREGIQINSVPQADAHVYEVSAASLIAKNHRDEWVHEYVRKNPQLAEYGFNTNFGYGTREHEQAIKRLGLTPLHRKFKAVEKKYGQKNALAVA